jgi:hypothetical protein
MSLMANPESKESGAHLRNPQDFLRALRGWKGVHTEATKKLRNLSVEGFMARGPQRALVAPGKGEADANFAEQGKFVAPRGSGSGSRLTPGEMEIDGSHS